MIDGWAFTQYDGTVYWDKAGIETRTPQDGQLLRLADGLGPRRSAPAAARACPQTIKAIVKLDATKRTEAQTKQLRDLLHRARLREDARRSSTRCDAKLAQAEQKRKADRRSRSRRRWSSARRPATPKPAYMLKRGEYDQRGEKVGRGDAGVPAAAAARRAASTAWAWPSGWSRPNHPLTARVAVNRFWQQVFGTGLVKTAEDFGSQGEPPSHPELLDWLAVQFREDGWDVKRLMKRLVMSATYRQSSRVTPETLAKDPDNRLLVARAAVPARRRDAARPGVVRQRPAGREGGRAERQAAAAAGLWEAVGYTGSNTAQLQGRHGAREGPSPQPVHLLEADRRRRRR